MTLKIQLIKKSSRIIKLIITSTSQASRQFDLIWNDSGTTHHIIEQKDKNNISHLVGVEIEKNSNHFRIVTKNFELIINNATDCNLHISNGSLELVTEGAVTLSKNSSCTRLNITGDKFIQQSKLAIKNLELTIASLVAVHEKAVLNVTETLLIRGNNGNQIKEINIFGEVELPSTNGYILANILTVFSQGKIKMAGAIAKKNMLYGEITVLDLKQNAYLFLTHANFKINQYLINEGVFTGKKLSLEFGADAKVNDRQFVSRNNYVLWAEDLLELKGGGALYNNGLLGTPNVLVNQAKILCNNALLVAKNLSHLHGEKQEWQYVNNRLTTVENFQVSYKETNDIDWNENPRENPAILNTANGVMHVTKKIQDDTTSIWKNSGILFSLSSMVSHGKFIHAHRTTEVSQSLAPKDITMLIKGFVNTFFDANNEELVCLKKLRENLATATPYPLSLLDIKVKSFLMKRVTNKVARQLNLLINDLCQNDSTFLEKFSNYNLYASSYCVSPVIEISNNIENAGTILTNKFFFEGDDFVQRATGHTKVLDEGRFAAKVEANIKGAIDASNFLVAAENLVVASNAQIATANRATLIAKQAQINGKINSQNKAFVLIEEHGNLGKDSSVIASGLVKFYAKNKLALQGYVAANQLFLDGPGAIHQEKSSRFVSRYFSTLAKTTELSGITINYQNMISKCSRALDISKDAVVLSGQSHNGVVGNLNHLGRWFVLDSHQLKKFDPYVTEAIGGKETSFNHLCKMLEQTLKEELGKKSTTNLVKEMASSFSLTVRNTAQIPGVIQAPDALLSADKLKLSGHFKTSDLTQIHTNELNITGKLVSDTLDLEVREDSSFTETSVVRGLQKIKVAAKETLIVSGNISGNELLLTGQGRYVQTATAKLICKNLNLQINKANLAGTTFISSGLNIIDSEELVTSIESLLVNTGTQIGNTSSFTHKGTWLQLIPELDAAMLEEQFNRSIKGDLAAWNALFNIFNETHTKYSSLSKNLLPVANDNGRFNLVTKECEMKGVLHTMETNFQTDQLLIDNQAQIITQGKNEIHTKSVLIEGSIKSNSVNTITATDELMTTNNSNLLGKDKLLLTSEQKITLAGRVVGQQVILKSKNKIDQEASSLILCKQLALLGEEIKLTGKIISYFNFLTIASLEFTIAPSSFIASTSSARIKAKLFDNNGGWLFIAPNENNNGMIDLVIKGDKAAEQSILNFFEQAAKDKNLGQDVIYKLPKKSQLKQIYRQLHSFSSEQDSKSLFEFFEPTYEKKSIAFLVENIKGNGSIKASNHFIYFNSNDFNFNGKLNAYAMRLQNAHKLLCNDLLKVIVAHQFKLKAPEIILQAHTKAGSLAIKADQLSYDNGALRVAQLSIHGHHKELIAGIKKHSLAKKIILAKLISGYEKNSLPQRVLIAVEGDFTYQTENLQATELLDVTTTKSNLSRAIDIEGSFQLHYTPKTNIPFVLYHELTSRKNTILLHLGNQDLHIQGQHTEQFLKLLAEKKFAVVARNVVALRSGVTGKEGIEFKLTENLKWGSAIYDRHLNINDVSSHLRARAGGGTSFLRRVLGQGGSVISRQLASICQQQKLKSDGSYLNTNGDIDLNSQNATIEMATVYAGSDLKGTVAQTVDNYSGCIYVGSMNNFQTSQWTQRALTTSVSNVVGDDSCTSQYILTPKPQVFVKKDSKFDFSITNKGGDFHCGGYGEFKKGHFSGENISAYDKHSWLVRTEGRRKHRVCGPRSQSFHYVNSGYVPAQQGDRPQKPYLAQFTSNQKIEITENVTRLYSEGQIQAPSIGVQAPNVTITPSTEINTTGRKYKAQTNLSHYFDDTKKLFTEHHANESSSPLYKRLHGIDSMYEKALEKMRLVYLQRNSNEVISEDVRQMYSFELQEILLQQALLDILGRSYVTLIDSSKTVFQATLEKTQQYAENLTRNQAIAPNAKLTLNEEELKESLQELLVYQQETWHGQPFIVPQLFLPATLSNSIEHRPVAYVKADHSIEFISQEENSSLLCIGVIDADGEIKISMNSVAVISRTVQENQEAFLNKKNGYISVPIQAIDRLSGNINSKQRVIINGKHYLQVGGELSSGEGGTFIEMAECIIIKGQRTTQIEQKLEHATKLGCNYALKPNFIQAKLNSKGDQLLVVTNGSAHMYGIDLHAEGKNIIKAKTDVSIASQKEEYQLATLDDGRLINNRKTSGQSEAVTGNKISAVKGIQIESSHGNIDLEQTSLLSQEDVDLLGIEVNWREGYCRHQIKEKSRRLEGLRYQQIRQTQFSSEALLSTAAIAGHLRINATHVTLSGVCGVIGRNLIVKAKKINFKGAVEKFQQNLTGKSLGVSFFGSHALESLIKGEKGSQILSKLLSDIPFCAAMRDLAHAHDFADVSVASIQTFIETMSLASMVHHAQTQNDSISDFCGALTDQLRITTKDTDGKRQFDPNFTIQLSSFSQSMSMTNEIGCHLSVLGTLELEGEEIIISGGTKIHSQDIILVAKKMSIISGKRELQSKQRRIGVSTSVKPISQQFMGSDFTYQRGDAKQVIHTNSSLTADGTLQANIEDEINIQGADIEALEVTLKSKLINLMSQQNHHTEQSKGFNVGFAVDALGNILPKFGFNQSSSKISETNISKINAKQTLRIMALRIHQVGSLIDVDEGELNVSYLYGQPILAQTFDREAQENQARSYYFLEGQIAGSALATFLKIANISTEHLFQQLIQGIQSARAEVQGLIIDGLCEWALGLDSLDALPAELQTHEFQTFIQENAEEAVNLPLPNEHPFKQYLERSDFVVRFLNYIRMANKDLLIENSSFFDAIYQVVNKPIVIWKRHPETMTLEKIFGDDQNSAAIHVLCKNDGRFHRLFKTNSHLKSVNWTTEDLKDIREYKQLSIALGLNDSEHKDISATLKSKEQKEQNVTKSTVLAKTISGQAAPLSANQSSQAIKQKTKSSKFSFGGHIDTKRFREIRNFVNLISQSENLSQDHFSKEELKKLKQKNIEEYKKFLKDLLRNILNDSDVVIDERLLDRVVEQFFSKIPNEQLSEKLSSYLDDLLSGDVEYERFCHSLYSDNSLHSSEDISSVSIGIIWLTCKEYQRNLQNATLVAEQVDSVIEDPEKQKVQLVNYYVNDKRKGIFSHLEHPSNQHKTWSPLFFAEKQQRHSNSAASNHSDHEHHHTLAHLSYLEAAMHATEVILPDLAPSKQARVGAILQKEMFLYDLKSITYNLKLPSDPLKFINRHALTHIAHSIHGIEPMVAFHESLEKCHEAGASLTDALIPAAGGTAASLAASYQLYNKYFRHLGHARSLKGHFLEGFGNALLSTKATSGFIEMTPNYFESSKEHSMEYSIANTAISTSVSLSMGEIGLFLFQIPHPIPKIVGTGLVLTSDLIGDQVGNSLLSIFEKSDPELPPLIESFDFKHGFNP